MTKTDERGKFSFSFSIRAFLSRDTQSSIAVYAPGYVQLREPAALREPITSINIDKDPERKKRLYAKEALRREWSKKMQANYDAGIERVEKVEDLDAKLDGYGNVLSTAHCYTGPDDINRDEIDLAKKILLEVEPLPTSPSQKEWVAWLRAKVEEMEKKRGLR